MSALPVRLIICVGIASSVDNVVGIAVEALRISLCPCVATDFFEILSCVWLRGNIAILFVFLA